MSLPRFEPMTATPWPEAFDDDAWWFEIKWDGYRAVVSAEAGTVRARSRRGLDLTGPFPELTGLPIPDGVVVDGEVVSFDEEGRPSFSRLQQRTGFGGRGARAGAPVHLMVFDLLYQGEDLTGLPYEERRSRLDRLALPSPILVPEPTPGAGTALYRAAMARGLEGVVGKRLGSRYLPGRRSPDWRKVSVRRRLRAVVGGYHPGEGGRARSFGSLLVGLRDQEGLRFIAAVGSGFDEEMLAGLTPVLHTLEVGEKPFYDEVTSPNPNRPVWVEPVLVVEVEYREWTHDQHLRAPVFKGLVLADPKTATWEEEGPG